MALLLADFPVEVGGLTVNRLCGSGLQAINTAAHAIAVGDGDVFIGGGVESMTRAPVRPAQGRGRLGPRPARARRHDARLAVRQPAAGRAALPVFDGRDRRERRRALGRQPRAAGRVRAREPAARGRRDRGRPVRRPDRAGRGRRSGRATRSSSPATSTRGRTRASRRSPSCARPSGPRAARSRPATPRASTTARPPCWSSRRSAPGRSGCEPMARVVSTAVAGVDPAIMGVGPVPGDAQGARAGRHRGRRPRPGRAQRGVRVAVARAASTSSASTRRRST